MKYSLKFESRPGQGMQARIQFSNGFGASIVIGPYTYGGDRGLFELAVLDSTGELRYDTPITDDVLGWLTPEDVDRILTDIESLTKTGKFRLTKIVLDRLRRLC